MSFLEGVCLVSQKQVLQKPTLECPLFHAGGLPELGASACNERPAKRTARPPPPFLHHSLQHSSFLKRHYVTGFFRTVRVVCPHESARMNRCHCGPPALPLGLCIRGVCCALRLQVSGSCRRRGGCYKMTFSPLDRILQDSTGMPSWVEFV
jgi:hypothetical protein